MADDPFTAVLKGLWDLLEANAEFTGLVKIGNRVKLWEGKLRTENKSLDDLLTFSDLPLVIIEPGGGSMNPFATSTGGMVEQVYRLKMVDGNLLLHKVYFPLKWIIFKALASADSLLGLEYVRRIVIEDGTDDKNVADHPGWNTGIDIRVTMAWTRAYLKT